MKYSWSHILYQHTSMPYVDTWKFHFGIISDINLVSIALSLIPIKEFQQIRLVFGHLLCFDQLCFF